MIKNYLTTALRNLVKHKVFSFINVFGLAIGITACLLILQYVHFERSYDIFHEKGDRIYRLQQNRYNEGKLSTQWAAGAAGAGKTFKDDIPEIEDYAKLQKTAGVMSYMDKKFKEENIYYANNAFLPIFSYNVISGNKETALAEPNTAVITKSTAQKYFGNENPIGKIISRNKRYDFKITAVVDDMPQNTHLKFNILLSFATFVKMTSPEAETTFNWDGFFTYVLLKPGADPKAVETKIAQTVDRRLGEEYKARNEAVEYKLQPLKDIHLYSNFMNEAEPNGDGKAVNLLFIISIFIIVIAWINYINLSTARSLDRAKEVGVRKVLGSERIQLIRQFLFESLVINFIAIALAFVLVLISLPLFNSLTGKQISFQLLTDTNFWIAIAVIFLSGTFLSGVYPAFVLSAFRPIEVLKGKLSQKNKGAWLRQSLVVIQFASSVALIIGTYCIYKQLKFMQSQDLGVKIDETLVIRGPWVTDSAYDVKLSAFKTEMLRDPAVKTISASSVVPGTKVNWNAGGLRLSGTDETKSNQFRVFGIDYDFLETYQLRIVKGRNFSTDFGSDTASVLLNEAAVKLIGLNSAEEALNKYVDFWGDKFKIVGVVTNHHQESLRENYDAYIYRFIPESNDYYSLKINNSARAQSILRTAEEKWAVFFPGNPFEYFFLDDHFNEQYKSDNQFGKTFALFAVLAIFIACLGLFGLASFVTTQRTKEIGIRKISGAGVSSILLLLTRDFLKPILISYAIAIPITYFLLVQWLQNYAFKTSINVWMFILPALLILLVAIVTISGQTIKAASANPVKNLRSE